MVRDGWHGCGAEVSQEKHVKCKCSIGLDTTVCTERSHAICCIG
jgi:hypothetical protein